jgi:hypothetical protein
MAGPTAVPGVDPSRVSTPDDLAACLDGLRRRRGLSYEAMEKAAAKLPSRSGGSRREPLPKSTVGEIVTGKRLPTKGKLLTFLTVCEVTPADLAQWLAAWERASTADLARPAGGVRVRDARPRLLGMHAAISVPGVPDDVPPQYVLRDVDAAEFGIRARVEAAAQRGGFVLLVGGSSVGKTRCAFEAVRTLMPDWWLVNPAGPAEVTALAQAPPPRTVVWLDELQRYLDGEHGLTSAAVRTLLGTAYPAVIIGTIWPDRYNAYTTLPAPGGTDPRAREREVLDLADVVRIDPEFSPAEQARARAAAARDPRLRIALESAGYGLTQTLAAAPQLVARWEDARTASPYGWAVLTAALDAVRLGARSPLGIDFLHAAAPGYCTSQQQAEAPENWFEQALAYATGKLYGAVAALSPAGAGMGRVAGYTVADYLIQHASRERRYARVPASTWDAVLSHIRDPADTARLAQSARNRLLYRYAIPLYRHATEAGEWFTAGPLADLLAGRGELDEAAQMLRARAEAGDGAAAVRLAVLRGVHGAREEYAQILRTRADAGDQHAARQLADLLAGSGDLDGLRARADVGDQHAARQLADLLARRGDLDGLRARAKVGDEDAAWRVAELLAERGDLEEAAQILRARAEAGDEAAAWRVAELLAKRGDLDGLRSRAEAGDGAAAVWLADLLAKHGDLDGLRARADEGDQAAAVRLADLLAKRGDLDRLRARAEAGDGAAAVRLADLLAKHRDLDVLRTRAHEGDRDIARRLADLLAGRGELDEAAQILRARAEAGDGAAAVRLTDLLAGSGDLDGLRARAEAGDRRAAGRLAGLLGVHGDLDGLRARADEGDRDAAGRLADLLAEHGDLDGLRARAEAGDEAAAGRLVDLLAERGDLDGLRARTNAGDRIAAERLVDLLADLLIKQGRDEEVARLRKFGLNPDGSIAHG